MTARPMRWAGVWLLLGWSATVWAVDAARLDYQLQARQIAPGTWVIEGAVDDFSRANGCNIINTGFVSTAAGTLVLNTGPSRLYGAQQRAALSRVVEQPVRRVVNLNLHPDYFLGNQAWGDVPTAALPGSRVGMQAEGKAYEDNLYRLCGDWMRGTEFRPAREDVQPMRFDWGGHALEWVRLQGHTSDDLVLIDHTTGVLFAGGLVFADRVPTLPHAHLPQWLASLHEIRQWILQGRVKTVVPSHGPVHTGTHGVDQTLDWLQWLHERLQTSAAQGLDISEVLRLPIPERFVRWAALRPEYVRNVTTLYPRYEIEQFPLQTAPAVTGQ
ncbi:MAG: quinoprotein relay system zinc metallohydrolase 1 [Pseudomonadota bacterium]|jgi:quinoprotein relay system zinc metallohydrolase 1